MSLLVKPCAKSLVKPLVKSLTGIAVVVGFKTEWTVAGDAAARTITLPLVQNRAEGALSYNCIVDWGDGTVPSVVTSYNDVNRIHTYASDGTYEVEITGVMEGWSFNNSGDKLKITKVISFGDTAVFDGFKYLKAGFYGCTNLSNLGTDPIPASGTGILTDGFFRTFFGCTSFTTLPINVFRYHPAVTTNAFFQTLYGCTALTALPTDVWRYNTLVSTSGFEGVCQNCSALTALPTDVWRYNTLVSTSGFKQACRGCTVLATVPADTFRYNTLVSTSGYYLTFYACLKLQQRADIFYQTGAQATRFASGPVQNFQQCFDRSSFTGVQGTAPDLWECDFGEEITLDVSPATDWDPGDIITGQSSGATSEVVSKTDATHYQIKKHVGTYTLGEIVGVTGVPAKLADQGAANPTFAGGPTMTNCWNGAGNSAASLDNYGDIPADWI